MLSAGSRVVKRIVGYDEHSGLGAAQGPEAGEPEGGHARVHGPRESSPAKNQGGSGVFIGSRRLLAITLE